MPRHLTTRGIDVIQARATRYIEWDGMLPGFGVRVATTGTKTFLVKYRLPTGRVRWATIGRVGTISLRAARQRAKDWLGIVARGDDPLVAKDAARDAPTVASVGEQFLAEHVLTKLKPPTQRAYATAIRQHLARCFGRRPIAEISQADILKLQERLRATPVLANRVLACASSMMRWAEKKGYRPVGSNPCLGIDRYREQPRRRYLNKGELERLGAALRDGARDGWLTPSTATALQFLALTGARTGEVLALRWQDIDIAAGLLRLPDSKTGQKTVYIGAAARTLLNDWPRHAGSDYVFPAESVTGHRVNLHDAWELIRTRAQLADVRLHDLRHSWASVGASSGQSLPIIGALLGHSQPATTQRYAHLMDDPLRAAADQTDATIAAALAGRH